MFRDSAEKTPLTRRLIREQTAPFSISLTPEDMRELIMSDGAWGSGGDGCITWRKDILKGNNIPSTVIHEMRHIQQQKEALWLSENVKEASMTANKVQESECACISSEYDGFNMPVFNKLKERYTLELKQSLKKKDIPYAEGLSPKEKKQARNLYIQEQATERALGETMALMMQPNGAKTVELASELDICLTADDLDVVEGWRAGYKNQALNHSVLNEKVDDVGVTAEEKKEIERVQDIMVKKYPVLAKRPFFKTGLTLDEALETDTSNIEKKGTYVRNFEGTTTVQSERVLDAKKGCFVERVYRNDQKHSLLYESETSFNGKKNKEVYYDSFGEPIITRQYKDGQLSKEEKVYSGGSVVNRYRKGELVESVTEYSGAEKSKEKKSYITLKDGTKKTVITYIPPVDGVLSKSTQPVGDFTRHKAEYVNGSSEMWHTDSSNNVVGKSVVQDAQGKKTVKYYTGEVVLDETTNKEVFQEATLFTPKWLREAGYESAKNNEEYAEVIEAYKADNKLNADNKQFYLKKESDTTYDVVFFDEAYIARSKGVLAIVEGDKSYKVINQGDWLYFNSRGDGVGFTRYNDEGKVLEVDSSDEETLKITQETRLTKGVYETRVYNAQRKTVGFYQVNADTGETIVEVDLHKIGTVEYTHDGKTELGYTHDGKLRHEKKALQGEQKGYKEIYYFEEEQMPQDENKGDKPKVRLEIETYVDDNWELVGQHSVCYRKNGTVSSITSVDAEGKGSKVCYGTDGKTKRAEGSGYYENGVSEDGYKRNGVFVKDGEWTYYTVSGEQKRTYEKGVAEKTWRVGTKTLKELAENAGQEKDNTSKAETQNAGQESTDTSKTSDKKEGEEKGESGLLKNLSVNAKQVPTRATRQQEADKVAKALKVANDSKATDR